MDGYGKMLRDDGGDCALLIRRRYQDGVDGECAMLQIWNSKANKNHLNQVATAIVESVSSTARTVNNRHLRDVKRHLINLGVVEFWGRSRQCHCAFPGRSMLLTFDIAQHAHVFRGDEVDGHALPSETTATTNAVDVVFTVPSHDCQYNGGVACKQKLTRAGRS